MAMTKITMLGDGGVGKSALTVRFYNDEWVGDAYDPTVEDMYRKQTDVDNKPSVLNILDTSGQEEYSAMVTADSAERIGTHSHSGPVLGTDSEMRRVPVHRPTTGYAKAMATVSCSV